MVKQVNPSSMRSEIIAKISCENIKVESKVTIFTKNDKWGLVNEDGEIILKAKYTHIKVNASQNNTILIRKDEAFGSPRWGACNERGEIIITPFYSSIKECGDHFIVEKEQQYGVKDKHGKVILSCNKDSIYHVSDSIFIFEEDHKFGLNIDNETVMFNDFSQIIPFKNRDTDIYDVFAAKKGMNDWYLYNHTSHELNYVDCTTFRHKSAKGVKYYPLKYAENKIQIYINDKEGYVYSSGASAVAAVYDKVQYCFAQQRSIVKINKLYGLIDHSGMFVVTPTYSEISEFIGDFAKVKFNGKYGAIDLNGELVVGTDYDDLTILQDRNGFIVRKDNQAALLDCSGNTVIEYVDTIKESGDPLMKFTAGSRWGLLSTNRIVVEPIYAALKSFQSDRAAFQNVKGYWGFLDRQGREVIRAEYTDVQSFHGMYALVKKDGLWGCIDILGNYRVQPKYHRALSINNDLMQVTLNGKGGVVAKKDGRVILECEYHEIDTTFTSWSTYSVHDENCEYGKLGIYDMKGVVTQPIYDEIYSNSKLNAKNRCIGMIGNECHIIQIK